MIKANKVRVGNWIKAFKQIGREREYFRVHNIPLPLSINGIPLLEEPIPLTPELLEKCGFKKLDIGGVPDNWYNQGTVTIEFKNGAFWFADNLSQISYIELKYLHQFQNILFALTGEELTVNL